MTDMLPTPPDEIVVNLAPGESEYLAQGGFNHMFYAKSNGNYHKVNVYQYEQYQRRAVMLDGMAKEFEDALKEALADGSIDSDLAQTFAYIFDINLKRSFEFTATVEFTFTVELPIDADPNDVADNLNFEISEGWGVDYELDNSDYNVTYADYTEV